MTMETVSLHVNLMCYTANIVWELIQKLRGNPSGYSLPFCVVCSYFVTCIIENATLLFPISPDITFYHSLKCTGLQDQIVMQICNHAHFLQGQPWPIKYKVYSVHWKEGGHFIVIGDCIYNKKAGMALLFSMDFLLTVSSCSWRQSLQTDGITSIS